MGIFRFCHLETQTDEVFVCIVNSEKKLSPKAPEFIPASVIHSEQPDNSVFTFILSKNDFDTYDDEPLCSYKEDQSSAIREIQCSYSKLDFGSCSGNANSSTELNQSESKDEYCYEETLSDFLEAKLSSVNDESSVSEH